MRKILLLFILVSLGINAEEKLDKKIEFLKKNLTNNLEYFPDENDKLLKKALIGKLYSPPHDMYSFNENGTFSCENFDKNKTYGGFWTLNGNRLLVRIDKKKKWETVIITKYYLDYDNDSRGYNFIIETDVPFSWDGSQGFLLQFR